MSRRQPTPRQWLIVNGTPDRQAWTSLRHLPRGTGVLLLGRFEARDLRRLRHLARLRRLTVERELPRAAARVHDSRELTRALGRRTGIVLLSPLFETSSHPGWRPLRRMRAAALARLGKRALVALGGMNARRYAKVAPLGFIGWAGISAFRT